MKNFDKWNKEKNKIDSTRNVNLYPKEKEIWWVQIGINVGGEIYGKGEMYLRPVLVVNAEDDRTFVGIPLTSKIKTSTYSCVIKTDDNRLHSVLTHQIRTFDRKRLWRFKYVLNQEYYEKVSKVFNGIYKIVQCPESESSQGTNSSSLEEAKEDNPPTELIIFKKEGLSNMST